MKDQLDTPPSYYKFAVLNLFYYHLDTHREFLISNLNSSFVEPTDLHADYQYSKILIDNYIKGLFNDQLALIDLDSLARINSDEYRQKDEAIFLLAQAGRFNYWDYIKDQYINKQNYGMWNTYYFYGQDPRYRNEVLERLIQEAESISSEEVLKVLSKANIVMTIDKSSGIKILKNRFYSTTGNLRLEYFRDLKSVDGEGTLERSMYGILNEPIDSIRKEYLPDPNRIHSYYFSEYLKPEFINFLLEQANTLDHSSGTYVLVSRYLHEFTPAMPDSTTPTNDLLNNLYNYVDSVLTYFWLGDLQFKDELQSLLQTAKTNLQNGDSLACRVQVKAFQDLVDNVYKDSLNTDARFVTIEGWKFLYWNAQYILDRLPEPPANPNLVVNLKNSLGNQIPASNVKYYEGSWKDAVNNGDGTFTVITTRPTVSIRVYYEYASLQADNVPAQNNTYTFQTVNTIVELRNSLGNLIDEGTVQYYAGAWRSFGTTTNGVAIKELLPINYSFRMTYEYGSIDKQQNLSADPTVVFQTVNAAVQLKNSLVNLIDLGTVQYYAGAWRTFGSTTNGIAYKELLPINYSFRMTYEFGSIDKQQNLSSDPTVVFQTVNAAVKLKNSLGALIDQGTVQYYAGAWRSFGTTLNGAAYKELLPVNYSFRMTYEYVSKDKQQNLSTNPVVDFSTVLCSVKVSKTSDNQPVNNAAVKYYAGFWRNLGTTNSDGITTKELLPANLSFRATYGNVSLDKQQDISVNNLVEILLNVP